MTISRYYSFLRILFILLFFNSILFSITNEELKLLELKIKQIHKSEELRLNRDLYKIIPKTTKIKSDIYLEEIKNKNNSKYCWNIKNIKLNDVTKLTIKEQTQIINKYTNRCIKFFEIDNLIDEIINLYIKKGYISTRVYIKPNQNLNSDTLELIIIEGKVSDLLFKDNDINKSVNLDNIFPDIINNYLNLRDIEQGIEQINRLQSNSSIMQIRPSSKVGYSSVAIYNDNKSKLASTLSIDNLGSESTGRDQLGLSFSLDNPLNLNDNIGMTYRKTVPFGSINKTKSLSLNYNIPYGYYTLFTGYTKSDYFSIIEIDSTNSINSTGGSTNSFITANRVVHRDQYSKLNTEIGLTLKSTKSYLNDILLDTSSNNLSVLNFNLNYFLYFDMSSLNFSISYSTGIDKFGATKDINITTDSVKAQFEKYNFNMSYMSSLQLFELPMAFNSKFSYQYSEDNLYGTEQIFIGGLYSVRGFEGVSTGGNRGFILNNDLSINQNIKKINATFFIAYDFGKIYSNSAIMGGELSGGAYGLKFSVDNILIELTKIFEISHSSNIDVSSNKGNYTYLSLMYSF